MGFAKMGADGSRVSTFVFQFGFISGRTLIILLCANHQLLFINLASVSRADVILLPPLRQALNVARKFNSEILLPHILWLTSFGTFGFLHSITCTFLHLFINNFMHCIQFGNINTAAMRSNYQFIFPLLNNYIMHRHTG